MLGDPTVKGVPSIILTERRVASTNYPSLHRDDCSAVRSAIRRAWRCHPRYRGHRLPRTGFAGACAGAWADRANAALVGDVAGPLPRMRQGTGAASGGEAHCSISICLQGMRVHPRVARLEQAWRSLTAKPLGKTVETGRG